MLDTPEIVETEAHATAVIRLTIPREDISRVMGPAIEEVMTAVAGQGSSPLGPVFSCHFRVDPAVFDFEVGVPVDRPVSPVGRVRPGLLPAGRVVRTIYRGPYEGLGGAWGDFCDWIQKEGLALSPHLWERYLTGPESSPDSADWQTELIRPLRE